jgi:dihydroorotase
MDAYFITGQTVFPEGVRPARIGIDPGSGVIVSVEDSNNSMSGNKLIFPGFVDAHVHAREYPEPSESDSPEWEKWQSACKKEIFTSAGNAAINGGVTAIAAMPNDPAPPDNPERYSSKLRISESSPCPVVLFACVTKNSEPWGDLPYKVYLDSVPSPGSFDSWSDLKETLGRYKGRRIFFHAEDPEILRKNAGKGPRWKTRPAEAETNAVRKILDLTTTLGLKTHICHLSTQEAVTIVHGYNRNASTRVTSEASPHHLFFHVFNGKVSGPGWSEIPNANLLESNPPLRSETDRAFLLDALKTGQVDMLATDHAPHTIQDKLLGAPGMPHLDTVGPFVSWLLNKQGFTPQRVAEALAVVPSEIFAPDLTIAQGHIEPGFAASFTILDLNAKVSIDRVGIQGRGLFRTRCGWSPFSGFRFPGTVMKTIVRGQGYSFYEDSL